MDTFTQFKMAFDREAKSEMRSHYFLGIFFVLLGLTMMVLIEFEVIGHQGSKIFTYSVFMLMIFLGSYGLYGMKIRYSISSFDKNCSDDQVKKGIDHMVRTYKMDILENDGTFYSLSFKPTSMTPLTLLNLFYDKDTIYINVRTISQANWDFEYGKTLEKKFITEIKTSR